MTIVILLTDKWIILRFLYKFISKDSLIVTEIFKFIFRDYNK